MKESSKNTISELIYAALGILFAAFALKSFIVPNHLIDGGVTGISLLLNEKIFHPENQASNIPTGLILGAIILLVNIPFIILSAYQVSRRFAFKTFISII